MGKGTVKALQKENNGFESHRRQESKRAANSGFRREIQGLRLIFAGITTSLVLDVVFVDFSTHSFFSFNTFALLMYTMFSMISSGLSAQISERRNL